MNQAFHYRRVAVVAVLLVLALLGLMGRFFLLQVVWHEDLKKEADIYTRTRQVIPPVRGDVKDRNGRPLAWSVPVLDVYADVSLCESRVRQVANLVAPLLGLEPRDIERPIYKGLLPMQGGPKSAVLLKRNVALWDWAAARQTITKANFGMDVTRLSRAEKNMLAKLRTRAVFARENQMRDYVPGNELAHVLGPLTPAPDGTLFEGLSGIERKFNTMLAGMPGYYVSRRDARGDELICERTEHVPPRNGASVLLTIDLHLQQIADAALAEAVRQTQAKSGSIIIMDPWTGEVLAIACYPAFDLRNPLGAPRDWLRHHPVGTQYEPGSTFKLITLVTALDLGLVTLGHRVNCEGGWWQRVRLHDHKAFGVLTLRDAFGHSSDIGLAKIGMLIGAERLYNYVTNFGFNRATGIELPGEAGGYVPHWTNWTNYNGHLLARISFGQGLRVTQLEMTTAYCAAVNGGNLMRPLLVRQVEDANGKVIQRYDRVVLRSVIRPETSALARQALAVVPQPGYTGWRAVLSGWTSGGKTSTAQKSDSNRYLPDVVYCGYIGHAPAEKPAVVIAVALDEPKGKSPSGGVVAAPVFRAVAEPALPYLGVPKDKRQVRHGLQLAGGGQAVRRGATESQR